VEGTEQASQHVADEEAGAADRPRLYSALAVRHIDRRLFLERIRQQRSKATQQDKRIVPAVETRACFWLPRVLAVGAKLVGPG